MIAQKLNLQTATENTTMTNDLKMRYSDKLITGTKHCHSNSTRKQCDRVLNGTFRCLPIEKRKQCCLSISTRNVFETLMLPPTLMFLKNSGKCLLQRKIAATWVIHYAMLQVTPFYEFLSTWQSITWQRCPKPLTVPTWFRQTSTYFQG